MGERIPAIIRFSSKYKIDESTGCWQWTGAVLHDGYGMFRMRIKKTKKLIDGLMNTITVR